jgi:hypothetical protein
MGLFISGSDAVLLKGHRGYLMETLVYKTNDNIVITVPEGFEFDGASIPDFGWSAVGHPFMRGYRRSAAIHDFLCRTKPFSSTFVHRIFYETLADDGVVWWRRQVLFNAVDKFGPKF